MTDEPFDEFQMEVEPTIEERVEKLEELARANGWQL